MFTARVIICWLEELFNHQSKPRFSRRLVDSTTNVHTLERHSQEQGADYKNRFKTTCGWKIMRSPMNAFPWLYLIFCVCQRCSGGGNSGLTLLNAKALIFYTLISLTDWLQTYLVGSYPLWNSRFGMRCFCKIFHSLLHFTFKTQCHYAGEVGLGPMVFLFQSPKRGIQGCTINHSQQCDILLLSFLSRIERYRHVSVDQDGTGHKTGSSHSWTRNQCHAVQQILPSSAHYLFRVCNQGECARTS